MIISIQTVMEFQISWILIPTMMVFQILSNQAVLMRMVMEKLITILTRTMMVFRRMYMVWTPTTMAALMDIRMLMAMDILTMSMAMLVMMLWQKILPIVY